MPLSLIIYSLHAHLFLFDFSDPSPNEIDPYVTSEDFVDVGVSLDVMHVMGIDVRTNTLEMLVGLELEWYDPRLSWEPFLGGCHRASFRASLDAELTEIWVPNLELVNMRTGVNSLPEATASVLYDGKGTCWALPCILKTKTLLEPLVKTLWYYLTILSCCNCCFYHQSCGGVTVS